MWFYYKTSTMNFKLISIRKIILKRKKLHTWSSQITFQTSAVDFASSNSLLQKKSRREKLNRQRLNLKKVKAEIKKLQANPLQAATTQPLSKVSSKEIKDERDSLITSVYKCVCVSESTQMEEKIRNVSKNIIRRSSPFIFSLFFNSKFSFRLLFFILNNPSEKNFLKNHPGFQQRLSSFLTRALHENFFSLYIFYYFVMTKAVVFFPFKISFC